MPIYGTIIEIALCCWCIYTIAKDIRAIHKDLKD